MSQNLQEAFLAKGYSLEESDTLTSRFVGIERVYGIDGFLKLLGSRVMVIGVGGVGSWAVEALVRSGVGKIVLVDLDDVCVSNMNRQLPALSNTVGQSKISVLSERMLLINPLLKIDLIHDFYTLKTSEKILSTPVDFVIDAIDSLANKAFLVSSCKQMAIPVVTVGGAGGKIDPTCIRTCDLGETTVDPLLKQLRKKLRQSKSSTDSNAHGAGLHESIKTQGFKGRFNITDYGHEGRLFEGHHRLAAQRNLNPKQFNSINWVKDDPSILAVNILQIYSSPLFP